MSSSEPLVHNGGNAATGGIWRLRSPGTSAVVKVARPPADPPNGSPAWVTSDEPTHWNYWRREVLAYTSGFTATVYADAGIVAPALLRCHERSDATVALWLADEPGRPGTQWSVGRLGAFARQLGHAQGDWAGRLPDLPWLSRDWLGQYLAARVGLDGAVDWEHRSARVWPAPVRDRVCRMWNVRAALLARARAAAPMTLCHLDVWPMNLIEAGERSVLLDWSFTGEGGLGEDPANLIVDSVADGYLDMAQLPAIAEAVMDGYTTGLREAGWKGSPDAVRAAIRAYGAAKYAWLPTFALGRVLRDGTFGSPFYGQDASGEAALRRLAPLVGLLADWAG